MDWRPPPPRHQLRNESQSFSKGFQDNYISPGYDEEEGTDVNDSHPPQWTRGVGNDFQKFPKQNFGGDSKEEGSLNRIKRSYGNAESSGNKRDPWQWTENSQNDEDDNQQHPEWHNNNDDSNTRGRNYGESGNRKVSRWQDTAAGFGNDRKPPQLNLGVCSDGPQSRKRSFEVAAAAGNPWQETPGNFQNAKKPPQENLDFRDSGPNNYRKGSYGGWTFKRNANDNPWESTKNFQNNRGVSQQATINPWNNNARNPNMVLEETANGNGNNNPWLCNDRFGNNGKPQQQYSDPYSNNDDDLYDHKRSYEEETSGRVNNRNNNTNNKPWQWTGGFGNYQKQQNPGYKDPQSDLLCYEDAASINKNTYPRGTMFRSVKLQNNSNEEQQWEWGRGKQCSFQQETAIRDCVRIPRSPQRNIPVEQVDEAKPQRNFGDYDPVRPRYLPKSAEFKSHLSLKDKERRPIFKGVSEQDFQHKNQLPQEEEGDEEESNGDDWRKELDAKYDAQYGPTPFRSSQFPNADFKRRNIGNNAAANKDFGGNWQRRQEGAADNNVVSRFTLQSNVDPFNRKGAPNTAAREGGGHDWRRELDEKYDAQFGAPFGSSSFPNSDFTQNTAADERGNSLAEPDDWRRGLDEKYDAGGYGEMSSSRAFPETGSKIENAPTETEDSTVPDWRKELDAKYDAIYGAVSLEDIL